MNETFHRFRRRKRRKGDTSELAAQLAPLEEQPQSSKNEQGSILRSSGNGGASQEYGAIVVDNTPGNLSQDIMEGGNEKTYLGMEPVVIVILGVMLVFITFIAWQISQLPVE